MERAIGDSEKEQPRTEYGQKEAFSSWECVISYVSDGRSVIVAKVLNLNGVALCRLGVGWRISVNDVVVWGKHLIEEKQNFVQRWEGFVLRE